MEKITTGGITEMIEMVKADKEARQVFLAMPREDQQLAILGMIAFLSSQIATMQKDALNYREKREQQENNRGELLLDTGQRIAIGIRKEFEAEKAREFNFWVYLRDKVVPGLIQFAILALLALIFANQLKP